MAPGVKLEILFNSRNLLEIRIFHRNERCESASSREWKQAREKNASQVGTLNLRSLNAEERKALVGAYRQLLGNVR